MIQLIKASLEYQDDISTIISEERIAGLASIREETSIESDPLNDILKKAPKNFDTNNFQQSLKIVFEASVEIKDDELIEFAISHLKEDKLERSIYDYYQTGDMSGLEYLTEDYKACETLARGRYLAGDKPRAMNAANHAITLDENSIEAWTVLGKVHKDLNQLQEAMDCFLRAIKCLKVKFTILPIYI